MSGVYLNDASIEQLEPIPNEIRYFVFDENGNPDHVLHSQIVALFAAAIHNHAIGNIAGLQTALDGKADVNHIHTGVPVSIVEENNTEANFNINFNVATGEVWEISAIMHIDQNNVQYTSKQILISPSNVTDQRTLADITRGTPGSIQLGHTNFTFAVSFAPDASHIATPKTLKVTYRKIV